MELPASLVSRRWWLLAVPNLGQHAAAVDTWAGEPASLTGELRQWHKITLTLEGPEARERDTAPNPFTDYRFTVTFTPESGGPPLVVPGYFAADGNAAETSAESGNQWRAHLAPPLVGPWSWRAEFVRGPGVACDPALSGEPVAPCHGLTGSFTVAPTDKTGRDFRGEGRLQSTPGRYLRFAGSRRYFLKAGADAPETLLACADFDNTLAGKKNVPLKTWRPHVMDWREGDPTWKDGKGKGLVGALNYLAGTGVNAFSFLTYNAGGDGDNVWPFAERDAKLHYDCSKLDQWGRVFDHATALGLFLHFKMQETEMDDDRHGKEKGGIRESLDGGRVGPERKLYCRELVARFGHALALNWNLGEENTQSSEEVRAMAAYLREMDPYGHPIVLHTYPNEQEKVYRPLLGKDSPLDGVSLQNSWSHAHRRTLQWVAESERAGRPWIVCQDEQNPPSDGVPLDPGFGGNDGFGKEKGRPYTADDIRKHCLWGTLLAGGAGVEYYFGYRLPQNDLLCEDWRSRGQSWRYAALALGFFREHTIPFPEMKSVDEWVKGPEQGAPRYAFAKPGEVYLVYLPAGGESELDLSGVPGEFTLRWFDPRQGGPLKESAITSVEGGGSAPLGRPPEPSGEDWLAVLRRP